MISDKDLKMLQRRRAYLRHLRTFTWVFPAIWLVTCLATFVTQPMLNNPFLALGQARTMPRVELETLVTMAPILTIIIQMLVITFVGMGLRMLWRERRLIELLEVALGAEAEEIDRV